MLYLYCFLLYLVLLLYMGLQLYFCFHENHFLQGEGIPMSPPIQDFMRHFLLPEGLATSHRHQCGTTGHRQPCRDIGGGRSDGGSNRGFHLPPGMAAVPPECDIHLIPFPFQNTYCRGSVDAREPVRVPPRKPQRSPAGQ